MSQTVAEYLVKIKGDSSSAEKAADTTERRFDGFQKKLGGWGKSLTGQAALSAVGFVGLTGPILGVGYKMVQSASDQEEALNKVNVVYGSNATTITNWADTSAVAMGMTRTQALDTAGTFGNIYTAMGFTQEEAGNMSMQFIGLATDLGSFNNVPTPEALQAIQSGLVGEYEPLKRFGILINEDKVKMKALEMGLGDANGNLTEQEKILARQQLIWEQSANAHGDFAETSDSLSNSTKILKAQLGNLSAELGSVLVPIVSKVISGIVGFLGGLGEISPTVKTIVVVIGAFLAALGPVLMIVSAMMPALGLLGAAFSAVGGAVATVITTFGGLGAILTGPIGLIIAALIALGVAYKTNFLGFGDAVRSVGSKIKNVFTSIVASVKQFVDGFRRAFRTLEGNPLEKVLKSISSGLKAIGGDNTPAFLVKLAGHFDRLGDVAGKVGDVISRFTDAFGKFRNSGLDPVSAAVRALGETFAGFRPHVTTVLKAIDKLKEGFGDIKAAISDFLSGDFSGGFARLKEGISKVFDGIKDILGTVDWSAVWDKLKASAKAAFESLKEDVAEVISGIVNVFKSIDWAAVWSGVKDIAGTVVSKLGDLAGALWNWVTGAIAGIDWAGIGSAFVSGFTSAWTAVSGWIDTIDFGRVGEMILGAAGVVASAASDLIAGIVSALVSAWVSVSEWISTIDFGRIGDMIGKASSVVGSAAKVLIDGIVTALKAAWTGVSSWISTIDLGRVGTMIGKAGNIVSSAAKTLIDGALTGFKTAWTTISGWIDTIDLSRIGTMITDAAQGVYDAALGLIGKVKEGFDAAWEEIKKWGIGIKDTVVGWFTFDIPTPKLPFGLGGGGDDDKETSAPTTVVDTAQSLPKQTSWDASGYVLSINNAIVAAMNAMSGAALAGALENWLWRAVGGLGGALDDDMMVFARAADTSAQAAFGSMSGASLAASITTWFTAAVGQVGPMLTGPMKTVAVAMDTAFVSAFASFSGASAGAAISGWLTKAVAVAATQMTVLDTIKTRFTTFISETTAALSVWSGFVTSTVTTTLQNVRTSVTSGMNDSKSAIAAFAATSTGTLTGWAGTVRSTVSGAMNEAKGAVNAGTREMRSAMSSGMDAIASAARDGMARAKSHISSAIGEIPGIISGIGGSAANTAYRIGANISESFASGMRSALGQIEAAAGAMVRAADTALRAKAQIASPSKLFRGRGKNSGGSYGIGIRDMIPDVARATAAMVHAATPEPVDFASQLGIDRHGLDSWARSAFSSGPVVDYRMTPNLASPGRVGAGNGQNGNVYVVMTRSELIDLFDTVDTVKVMTDQTEFLATFGG